MAPPPPTTTTTNTTARRSGIRIIRHAPAAAVPPSPALSTLANPPTPRPDLSILRRREPLPALAELEMSPRAQLEADWEAYDQAKRSGQFPPGHAFDENVPALRRVAERARRCLPPPPGRPNSWWLDETARLLLDEIEVQLEVAYILAKIDLDVRETKLAMRDGEEEEDARVGGGDDHCQQIFAPWWSTAENRWIRR